MATILLKLAAPLQSWGAESKFNRRVTEREPTKSGVIGLVAAALGRTRDDAMDDLRGLKFAVRTDQPGTLVKDFHTAHTFDGKTAFISDRYYLSDAVFVAALEGDDALIADIEKALENPVYPLSLGRRACPPVGQLVIGRSDRSAVETLLDEPWQASEWYRKRQPETIYLEIVRDADPSDPGAYEVRDVPVTFSQSYRKYDYRSVKSDPEAVKVHNEFARRPSPERKAPDGSGEKKHFPTPTDHDAFNELEQ